MAEIFDPGGPDRDRQIVVQYFGWDGHGRRTLEALGREYGLTRERIRQICSRAVKQQRNVEAFAPVLDRAIAFLAERTPMNLAALQAEFDKSRISACRLSIESVCQAARFLGRKLPFATVAVDKGRVVVAAGHARLPAAIVRAAKRAAASYGAAAVADVVAELSARLRAKAPRRLVRKTLESIAGCRWLDAGRRWFQLDSTPSAYGLPNMIDKILSVCPRIDVLRMRTALARNGRSRRPLPPPKVLLEFCRHTARRPRCRERPSSPPRRAIGTRRWRKSSRSWCGF